MAKMTKESKQLNWLLAAMAIGAIVYSCVEVVDPGYVSPRPIQIDVSLMPASEHMIMLLADMSTDCDIEPELTEAAADDVLTYGEVIDLGDLCVARAEAEALEDNPHALDVIRNEYENDGGLRM